MLTLSSLSTPWGIIIFILKSNTKPTRITEHSTTLIDNIFFNSLEYHTVSGNLVTDTYLTICQIFLLALCHS